MTMTELIEFRRSAYLYQQPLRGYIIHTRIARDNKTGGGNSGGGLAPRGNLFD